MELKIGDVVRLKSDVDLRVLMTINGYSSDGKDYWHCVWFVGTEMKSGNFHKDALAIVN